MLPSAKIGAFALWDSWCSKSVRFRRSHTTLKCLSYSDFATTEMLIPEGSEHLFKDIYTAKADELYHHVLDKFGWAWRDPKYKSETELCAMLKWAKEKGLTIEELSI